jgi:sugar lactone lactonase YvrE
VSPGDRRLIEHDQPVTFVGNLHGPLGMTFDEKNGRLISLQTEPGFTGRVVWPTGEEAIIADNYEGKPFGRPNDIIANRNGGHFRGTPPMTREFLSLFSQQFFNCNRETAHSLAGRMIDGICNRWRHRDGRQLAKTLGPQRARFFVEAADE